jgi:hypothetical protein
VRKSGTRLWFSKRRIIRKSGKWRKNKVLRYIVIFGRAFGVIRPKREPRPGAEPARVAESPASAFYEDTSDETFTIFEQGREPPKVRSQ